MAQSIGALTVACALLAGGCSRDAERSSETASPSQPKGPLSPPWFEEAARSSGMAFQHRSGAAGRYYIPEMMTGGVGLLDFDNDGFLDVYCVNGGSLEPGAGAVSGHKLFRNRGDGTFEDVTDRAGVAGRGYGMGCACADYDNDGDTDIYVTNVGPNLLYRNNGDGTFTDVTDEAGAGDPSWGTSCAFFDYDRDGYLDLIIANYLHWLPARELECYSRGGLRDYCSPMNYKTPAMDTLYHNQGNGSFKNVTVQAGLDKAYGNGLGVACADFDRDGRIDFYVANDAMPNQLWMNQGDGTFHDAAMLRGCAVNYLGMAEAGMGVVAVDIQNDGWADLFVTHLVGEHNRLYVNTNGYFMDSLLPKGPGAPSLPYTGFGVGFADFDHDGHLDLFVANGRVKYGQRQFHPDDPYAEPNQLLHGLGAGEFNELVPAGGTEPPLIANSRGAALGDLDNDGDMDIVVINRDGPIHYLRNVAAPKGNWVMFRVVNTNGSDAIGATLRIETGGGTQWRQVSPNEGYCSSNDPRIHFGLGSQDRVEKVTVRWPKGTEQTFGPYAAGRLYELRER